MSRHTGDRRADRIVQGEPKEGTPILLEFVDGEGRNWTAAAIAGPARLEGGRSVDYRLEALEELGMKLVSFRVLKS